MEKLRVGIIGCGGIAFGKHMPNLKKTDKVDMVAFFDLDEERAEKAKLEYGTVDAKVYSDYRQLLEDKNVDAVHILTPNASHAPISIDALNAGKHVMVEKPMASKAADARKMVETAEKTGKRLSVGYQSRSTLEAQYLKQMIVNGELGDIYFARAIACRRRGVPTWGVFTNKELQGGGPLIDIATHTLDLVLWLMDNYEPESVMGTAYDYLKDTKNAANLWGPWDPEKYEVETSAFGLIRFKNGASVILESSWAINMAQFSQTVFCGSKAGADLEDGLRINGERNGALYVNKVEITPYTRAEYPGRQMETSEYEMNRWVDAVLYDAPQLVTGKQAMVVSEILEAIYTSSETGKPVYFA
ncbi:MAG: Gfo/Idh/MocA family oxidoreductase [Anaerolineaceae bacterium]|nr:Gfo/Idh/MocA family oxidoreductase [Anaerolineaceae bacterium]